MATQTPELYLHPIAVKMIREQIPEAHSFTLDGTFCSLEIQAVTGPCDYCGIRAASHVSFEGVIAGFPESRSCCECY